MKTAGSCAAYTSPMAKSKAAMLRYAPAKAAPFPAMNSSAAPGDTALSISMAVAEPKMLIAKYWGLAIQGPLITRTKKKLENKALKIMSGMAASDAGQLSQGDPKTSLRQAHKMKAFPA